MRKQSFELVIRLRVAHRPGQLARVASTVAAQDALLGEINIVQLGDDDTTRDITIEGNDAAHADRVVKALRALEGVDVLATKDPVFVGHEGGKIRIEPAVRVETVQDM